MLEYVPIYHIYCHINTIYNINAHFHIEKPKARRYIWMMSSQNMKFMNGRIDRSIDAWYDKWYLIYCTQNDWFLIECYVFQLLTNSHLLEYKIFTQYLQTIYINTISFCEILVWNITNLILIWQSLGWQLKRVR